MTGRWRARVAVFLAAALFAAGLVALWRGRHAARAGADGGVAALVDGGALDGGGDGDGGAAALARAGIAGRVIDRRGRAAAGAEVWLGGATLGAPGVRKLRANADGSFVFAGLAPGRYALRAFTATEAAFLDGLEPHARASSATAGASSADAGVSSSSGGASSSSGGVSSSSGGASARDGGAASPDGGAFVTVALHAAVALAGHVRERGGAAIAGGEVALVEGASDAAALLARRATASADGAFRFDAVEPGGYLVFARADGFLSPAPLPLQIAAQPSPPPLDVRLERGARLDGRVVDEQGRPVAGAQVEVAGEGEGGAPIALTAAASTDWPRRAPEAARVEPSGELGILRGPIPFPPPAPLTGAAPPRAFLSDGRGAFHVPGVPAGRVVVAASHPDFARGSSAQVAVAAGALATVEVVLRRGRTVRGRVTDERGAPLGGAEILVDGRALTASDARGEFQLPHVVGAFTAGARLQGWVPQSRALGADDTDVELRLARAEGRLAGVIVDERGAPVAGAKLEISSGAPPPRALTADRAGSFRAEGLGPGPYRVRVEHPDYAPLSDQVAAPADDVRLQLDPGAGVSGELRDARSGGVPAGARLELSTGGVARPLALSRGRFEATGLPAGRATLSAGAPGYVPWSRELELVSGERPRELTLRDLTVELERGGAIAGTVVDDDGQPAAGAQLSVVLPGAGSGAGARGRSDARGEFRLDGLPSGRLRVRAEFGGRRAEELVEVRADDESRVELRLPR
ncbi:MAG TPA: carboxypeptidase-like regulatory domain-containing protein [Polyangia bacterium]|nr:carboxypeptidase-like regulatory domain-containing protein [Polyangia bacterium]